MIPIYTVTVCVFSDRSGRGKARRKGREKGRKDERRQRARGKRKREGSGGRVGGGEKHITFLET